METIEQKVRESLKNTVFAGDKEVEEFEKANQKFEELIEKGLIKKRGNNLLSVADAHVKRQAWFNVKQKEIDRKIHPE